MKSINNKSNSGGANTNINGLNYEEKINKNLTNIYDIQEEKDFHHNVKINDESYKKPKKNKFRKQLKDTIDKNVKPAHGCKEPDACFIDEVKKIIHILEMKYQCQGGSVCEKLQTGVFKRNHYSKLIPGYKISYIYILSPWFKENCAAEIEFLEENNIPVFWNTQKLELENYIINYK